MLLISKQMKKVANSLSTILILMTRPMRKKLLM